MWDNTVRQTPRKELLKIEVPWPRTGSCYLCGEEMDHQTSLLLEPTLPAHRQVLGYSGIAIHLHCLYDVSRIQTSEWSSPPGRPNRRTVPWYIPFEIGSGDVHALVLGRDGSGSRGGLGFELGFDKFGVFEGPLQAEYRKGCLWCCGKGHAPGVVLNFPLSPPAQRFRLIHTPCIEEIYNGVYAPYDGGVPVPDPEPLLRGLSELLQLT
jgi:hypothetical protein